MSPAIAKGIINQIINSRLNYTAQLHELPTTYKTQLASEIHKLLRVQYGLAQPTTLSRMHTDEAWGGLGVEDPNNVADRAMLAEYLIAMNSEK